MTDRSDFTRAGRPARWVMVSLLVLSSVAAALATVEWYQVAAPREGATARLALYYALLVLAATPFIRQRGLRAVAAIVCTAGLAAFFIAR